MLTRLTVVIGGFTLDAAEAIATGGDVNEFDVVGALAELEDAGLIVQEHVGGEVRHRLLEPIRQHVATAMDETERTATAHRHAHWFSDLAGAVKGGSIGADFGRWADLVERDLANFRQAHRLLIDLGDTQRAVAIVDGLSRGRGPNAGSWSSPTGATPPSRWSQDGATALNLPPSPLRSGSGGSRTGSTRSAKPRARMASVDGDAEHHLALEESAAQATLDPTTWREAIERLEAALTRYGSDEPDLVERADSPSTSCCSEGSTNRPSRPSPNGSTAPCSRPMFAFYRAVPYYMRDDDATAADLAGQAVTLARAAGALVQLATALLGHGGWRARVADATTADVFGPLVESLDLWERLRIPWGRVAVIEEIAQALAIRGHQEEAFVLWGAVDASGIQAPSKVGRIRRTDPYIADVPTELSESWRRRRGDDPRPGRPPCPPRPRRRARHTRHHRSNLAASLGAPPRHRGLHRHRRVDRNDNCYR